jgi:threonine/homoserine/homoserine lactone efflux protein
MGSSNRWAGLFMALGHGIVEFPLMLLLLLGAGRLLKRPFMSVLIGFAGGGFLVFLAVQMLQGLGGSGTAPAPATGSGPLAAGIFLSAGNPYFLVWWATVGLTLITTARNTFGLPAFGLMALVHWSCDLIWLTVLSWASFRGSVFLGPTGRQVVLAVCAAAMFGFGLYFVVLQAMRLAAQRPPTDAPESA